MLWQHNLLRANCSYYLQTWNMVPTGTGNERKPGKMGRHFPVRQKSVNVVKTGKSQGILLKILEKLEKITLENCKKYWKSQENLSV